MYVVVEENSGINSESFAGIQLYRPRSSSELKIRLESESHLRSKFDVGVYNDPKEINQILLHQFDFYSKKFNEIIPKLASRYLIEFILFEYDKASDIEEKHKHGQLNQEEADRWRELGSKFRRAAKYLCERVVLLQPEEVPDKSKDNIIGLLDEIWIAAEEMVNLYLLSDQTFLVFPNESIFEIYPKQEEDFVQALWSLDVNNKIDLSEKIVQDTANRPSIIGDSNKFLTNISWQDSIIASNFKEEIGVSFDEAIKLLKFIIQNSQPALDSSFSTLFIRRSDIVETLHKRTKISQKSIEIVIDGFTVCKEHMEIENRELWKPKQKYRAFRRGFFEMPHATGIHLAFCKNMALESLQQLVIGSVFQKIPSEWSSKKVNKAIRKLSTKAGKKFEEIVEENLATIGIAGRRSINKQIGNQKNFIKIPSEVGEIDFLGYSAKENFLLIAECKLVQGGFEGKFFRDDIQDFVKSKRSYLKKFDRKVKWLLNNHSAVISALNSMRIYPESIQPTKIVAAFITYYPTIAEYFIEDYPCVSITNLILDYHEKRKWSYSKGIFNLA